MADPMEKFMDALAAAEEGGGATATAKVAEKQLTQEQQQEITDREMRLKERALQQKEREQAHREQQAEIKRREEQLRQTARAMKTASEVKGAAEAMQTSEEDTIPKRIEVLRKIGLMQQQLGTTGTGRRVTRDTPLPALLAELDVHDQQANLRRAGSGPELLIVKGLQTLEIALRTIYNIDGASDDFRQELEKSRASSDPLEQEFDLAMKHCSIKYSHWFAVSPEKYIALKALSVIRDRHDRNVGRAMAEGDEDIVDEDLIAEIERRAGKSKTH